MIASSRNGSLFLSTDAARQWNRLPFPWMPGAFIEAIKIHPLDPQLFLVAVSDETGEHAGLYQSADGGQTWTRTPEIRGEGVFSLALFLKDPNVIGAGTRRGVFLSPDRGRTWRLAHRKGQPGPMPVMSLAFDPENPAILYAGTTHLPWKTTDGGQNWRSIHEGMIDDSDVFSIHVDSKHPEKIHASACSGIYLSDTRGDQWRRVQGIPGSDRRTHIVTEDPAYSSLLFAGTTAGLWKSADAGNSWRKLNDYIVRSVEFHPRDGRLVYMATQDRGMLKSTTAAFRFEEVNQGFTGIPVVKVLTPAGRAAALVAMGVNGRVELWRRDGMSWKRDPATPRFREAVWFGSLLFLADEKQVFREVPTSTGTAWEPVPDLGGPIQALGGGSRLVAVTNGRLRSSTDGRTWNRTASPALPSGSTVLEVLTGGDWEVVRLANGYWFRREGVPWSKLGDPPGRIFQVAAAANGIWAATASGLFRTADGNRWRRAETGLPDGFLNTIVPGRDGQEWFTSQVGQVFRSRDGGETWSPAAAPLSQGLIGWLTVHESRQVQEIFAFIDGQGVYVDKTLP